MANRAESGRSSSSSLADTTSTDKPTQIHVSHLHTHLLLYERQYDSARTIYALDTLLNMIETLPNRILYSMATTTLLSSTFSDVNNVGGIFDGTRASRIKDLYHRHASFIMGKGFVSDTGPVNQALSTTASSSTSGLTKSKSFKSIVNTSSLRNISLLELVIKICLQYLHSYYSSCPSSSGSSPEHGHHSKLSTSSSVEDAARLLATLNISQSYVDLDLVSGNQRVRLMACEILRVIFCHLSTMMDNSLNLSGGTGSGHGSSKHHKRQPSTSDSTLPFSFQMRPFAHYLHDMMIRCEVQKYVLQSLVTSVWHYQQQTASQTNTNPEHSSQPPVMNTGYLFPNLNKQTSLNQADASAANAFVQEILDFNDYPMKIVQSSNKNSCGQKNNMPKNNQDVSGFHDEFEKCLLRLLEQVLILENRVSTQSNSNLVTPSPNDQLSQKMQRFQMDLMDIRFDPTVSIAGQPLLHAAILMVLKQDYRRHIQPSWLSFVEASLPYAGRYLPRLVLCVINQLCANLEACVQEIKQSSSSDKYPVANRDQPPFVAKHLLVTLQGITMLTSYCLLDKNSHLNELIPFLNEMMDENEGNSLRCFGLVNVAKGRKNGRYEYDPSNESVAGGGVASQAASNGQLGGLLSNFMHTFSMSSANSGSSGVNPGGNSGSSALTSQSLAGSYSGDAGSLLPHETPALLEARKSVLSVLNRVVISLFSVWYTLVSVEEMNSGCGEDHTVGGRNQPEDVHTMTTCCHYYYKFQQYAPLLNDRDANVRRHRFKQSSCSLGWSTSTYTGWYIMGSSSSIRRSILIVLGIVLASNNTSFMSSLAQVWNDLRDRSSLEEFSDNNRNSFLNGNIDIVISSVSPKQRHLVQMIYSLNSMFPIKTLIKTIRNTFKVIQAHPPISNLTASHSIDSAANPLENIFFPEISLMQFFLSYIRACPSSVLLSSVKPILSLIKDALALNVTTTISPSLIGGNLSSTSSSISSANISTNIQPLVNFHLLAILHELLNADSTTNNEVRQSQKELQDVTQKLLDSMNAIANGRLTHNRWSFKRNFEVLPLSSNHHPGGSMSAMNSPINGGHHSGTEFARLSPLLGVGATKSSTSNIHSTTSYDDMATAAASSNSNEQPVIKRSLFRPNVTVSFHERKHHSQTNSVTLQSQQSISDNVDSMSTRSASSSLHLSTAVNKPIVSSYERMLTDFFGFNSGLFMSSVYSGSDSSLSQSWFDSFFCIKSLYALSEVSSTEFRLFKTYFLLVLVHCKHSGRSLFE